MLTRNEEDRVSVSLAEVRDHVHRMIVLDAESDDATRELAQQAGAEVVVRPWEGFVSARRYLLSLVTSPWVLMIDADEVIEPGLWLELESLGFPECSADGFQMRRRTVYEGKKLRRAFQPDWKMSLVRVGNAYFEDRFVHESMKVKGVIERLRTEILHSSFRSADDHHQRIRTYARLAAQDLAEQGKRVGFTNLWLRPAWRWFKELILQGGIADGLLGLKMASRSAYGVHLSYRYLREMNDSL